MEKLGTNNPTKVCHPVRLILGPQVPNAALAQRIERDFPKVSVGGSNPSCGTLYVPPAFAEAGGGD